MVRHLADHDIALTFHHDSQQGLGAGIAHEHSTAAVQCGFGGPDRGLDIGNLIQIGFVFDMDVQENLRDGVIALANSDSGFPVRFISERICNAEINPSPVVL